MIALGNILKVVVTIIVGYIVGFILGSIFGAIFGLLIGVFIQDITSPQQAASFSIFVSLTMGGLISLFLAQIFNSLFETNINSFLGAIPGALVGVILVLFIDGYFDISTLNIYPRSSIAQSWVITSIMPYSSTIGRQIGSILFPLFGTIGVIREIIKSQLELQKNRKLMKDLHSSHWGMPEIPRETPPMQPSRTTRPFLSLPSFITSTKGGIILFVLKAFITACTTGIILSILGWQVFGWTASIQYSKGLFWASAMFAMYGFYFNRLGANKANQNLAVRYGETVGDMDIEERTKQWTTDSEASLKPLPSILLISAFLFGFSILTSMIF